MNDLTGAAQDINKMLYHADFDGGNVRVSENGIVTICVHGLCIVRDLKGWHQLAIQAGAIKGINPLSTETLDGRRSLPAGALDGGSPDYEARGETPAGAAAVCSQCGPNLRDLKTALENTACRTDGDGEMCWCDNADDGSGHSLRDGLYQQKHALWCKNARAALKGEPLNSLDATGSESTKEQG